MAHFPRAIANLLTEFFQTDLSQIRIHRSALPRLAGVRAFAYGDDIHIAPGEPGADSTEGVRLLAHEVCHVLQQRSGRLLHSDRKSLEQEAEFCEGAILRGSRRPASLSLCEPGTPVRAIQCAPVKMSREAVLGTPHLTGRHGNKVLDFNWFREDRNPRLFMVEYKENDHGDIAYQMPDNRVYNYNNGLYGWVENGDEFYDPINLRVLHRYEVLDAGSISQNRPPIAEAYYYAQVGGDYYFYDQGSNTFVRHDLISNFRPGDLLYGTEYERMKVRRVLQDRLPHYDYITADNIHHDISLTSDIPQFVQFDENYDAFLRGYGTTIDANKSQSSTRNPERFHPSKAQAKETKTGVRVSTSDVKIRRSCKALLTYMMRQKNARIHFVVDSIDTDRNLFTDVEKRHVTKYKLYLETNFFAYSKGKRTQWPWPG